MSDTVNMAENELLKALEMLMNEFFNERTPNSRKREIENSLNDFNNTQGAWRHCLCFMTSTKNEYVMMFCLNVLEHIVKNQWIGMLGSEKAEIRNATHQYLLACHHSVPLFVRNKLGKLIVDIGRLDWPHFYPDFFSNILQLVQSSDTASLGLMLLQTVSEEFVSPREDISASRKEELYRLLTEHVPNILNVIGGLLDLVLERHHCLTTATPPPSPTQGQDPETVPFNTNLYSGGLLHNVFKSLSDKKFSPALDAGSYQLCVQGLNCLTQFFSWIPLSAHISSSLLATIFQFASFGCDSLVTRTQAVDLEKDHTALKRTHLGTLAMGCINEIMSRNCIPADFDDFLLQMFQYMFHLLQQLTKEENVASGANNNHLFHLDENYVEKFTDFLQLFVNAHLQRFENNSQFSVLEFLTILFKYTFLQPTHQGFFSCLDIWGTFLDYLTIKLKTSHADHLSIISQYKETLILLVNQILQKLQFKYNQSNLEELDDESLDENCETEWQHFLRHCLDSIAKVADLMPAEVFTLLYSLFEENQEIYLGLEHFVQNEENEHHLRITAENECRRLHCSLRDLSSLLQGIGRLEYHFIGDVFEERFLTAQTTVKRLCAGAVYSNKMKLYNMKTAAPLVLKNDFIEVHAQVLATLKAFSHWLFLFGNQVAHRKHGEQEYVTFVTTATQVAVANIIEKVPEKIAYSSSHLLKNITSIVRPPFLCNLQMVQELYTTVCQRKVHHLSIETQKLVHRSIANILLLPWPNITNSNQQWEKRSSRFEEFITSITSSFRQLHQSPNFSIDSSIQEQGKPVVKWTIDILHDMVANIMESSTRTKHFCYQALQDYIQIAASLVPIYLNSPEICEDILDFFLTVFIVFKNQMGASYMEETVQAFLGLFTRQQLTECILKEGSSGCHVVEKFLQLLQQTIKDPAASFKPFLTKTLNFCMNDIYPIIAESSSPELKQSLFELLYQFLLNNWRFFFKSNVTSSLRNCGNDIMENTDQFTKIMQAYGQTFLQPDISLFRQNLEALESLNNKWKLYHKSLFKSVMLNQFLNVLLQALISKSYQLLCDDICLTIYNMALVNFDNFYAVFLPQFLQSCDGLDNSQKTILAQNFKFEKDLPTFTQILHRFVNDLRYYHLCNSSLPASSISL